MTVLCTGCGDPLPPARYNSGKEFRCGNCDATLVVEVFPALFDRADSVKSGEAVTSEGEASCFYHPHKKAAALCSACGRFLCTLCETELAGRCLCPSCIEKGCVSEEIEVLVSRRTLFDSMALSLAVLPLLFFPITTVTAPIALFVAIRYWKKPGSILPRTRIRFVAALLLALAQIVGWVSALVISVR